jgi:hypothetical protein
MLKQISDIVLIVRQGQGQVHSLHLSIRDFHIWRMSSLVLVPHLLDKAYRAMFDWFR